MAERPPNCIALCLFSTLINLTYIDLPGINTSDLGVLFLFLFIFSTLALNFVIVSPHCPVEHTFLVVSLMFPRPQVPFSQVPDISMNHTAEMLYSN